MIHSKYKVVRSSNKGIYIYSAKSNKTTNALTVTASKTYSGCDLPKNKQKTTKLKIERDMKKSFFHRLCGNHAKKQEPVQGGVTSWFIATRKSISYSLTYDLTL